jgi:acyl carrier protein
VTENQAAEHEIQDILWQSLRGGNYNLDDLQSRLRPDSPFEELGIDSLDMTDFIIRIEDRFKVKILQEEYPKLSSVRGVERFLAAARSSEPAER